MAHGRRHEVRLERRMRSRCEVAVPPILIHLKLHWSDVLMYPRIGNTQDGLVRQIHVRDPVTNVRWIAWELLMFGVVLLRYFRPAEEQSSCWGRCSFRLVEKVMVKYMEW